MNERTDTVPEHLDLEPVDVPADGTWSPEIEGDGTGATLPPIDPDASPPGADQPGDER